MFDFFSKSDSNKLFLFGKKRGAVYYTFNE